MTELCPSCGHLEAYSEEKQLRSADEGSTILYTVSFFFFTNFSGTGIEVIGLDFRSVSSANTDGGLTTSHPHRPALGDSHTSENTRLHARAARGD